MNVNSVKLSFAIHSRYVITGTSKAVGSEKATASVIVMTAFEVPVITYREWTANDNFTEFSFKKQPKTYRRLKMAVQSSSPVAFTKELIENPGHASPQRLAFTFKEPVAEATFTTVYSTR